MNVFVLCAGRTGSVSFSKACGHMTNFTSGHETRAHLVGAERFAYPDQHIEVDNRLSWFLGRLDERYGQDAFYVHLRRDPADVARSFEKRRRRPGSIIRAFARSVYLHLPMRIDWHEVSLEYAYTVDANIQLFLRDKPHKMEMWLESWREDFAEMWKGIGATGDLEAALRELDVRHNASEGNDPVTVAKKAVRGARRAAEWLRG